MKKSMPWIFALHYFGQSVGAILAMSYNAFYMTENLFLSVGVMSVILMISKISDMVIGIFIGAFVQKFQSKMGRFRFWILIGAIGVAAGNFIMFLNFNVYSFVKIAYVLIGHIILGAGQSVTIPATGGMMAKAAGPEPKNRLLITARGMTGVSAGSFALAFITMPVILLLQEAGQNGYLTLAAVYSTISLASQLTLFFVTKDIDVYDPKANRSGSNVSFFSIYKEGFKNTQLLLLMIADILRTAAQSTFAGMFTYYFAYIAKTQILMAPAMTIQSMVLISMTFITPLILGKTGKKAGAIISVGGASCLYGALALFLSGNTIVFIVINACATAFIALVNGMQANMYLDAGEYWLYKTGIDNRPFCMSMYGFSVKTGQFMQAALIPIVLYAGGYNPSMTTMANPEGFMRTHAGIPAIFLTVSMAFYMCFKVNKAKAKEYAEENLKRLQAQAVEV